MLQIFREKAKGLMSWIILLLVAGVFTLWGVSDYFSIGSPTVAAKVNGQKIPWQTVEVMSDRVKKQYRDQIDEKTLKDQVRMSLVKQVALVLGAKSLGFRIGDEQLGAALQQIPAFQVDGHFSKERYLTVLEQAGYVDASFRQEFAQEVLVSQLQQGLAYSNFSLQGDVARTIALLDQKRDLGYATIPLQKMIAGINISPEELKGYYEGHKINFVKPEQIALEYVELSLDALAKQVAISKPEVLAYYNEHQSAYSAPERVHARHILLTVPAGDTNLDKEAKTKADSLVKELNQGADFTALAKKFSQDPVSAEKGGDLGWFIQGQMIPEFEKAAFGLEKENQIAGPVHTQFGYHIIQLLEHRPAETRPLKEVEKLVEEQLRRDRAQVIFAEQGEQLAKLAFEQANSLDPIAKQLNLKIKETELFDGQNGKGIASHPEVVKAAFNEAIVKEGRNSEPLKTTEGTTVVFRMKKYVPAIQKPYEDVMAEIQEKMKLERAAIAVKELGETLAKNIEKGEAPQALMTAQKLEWTVKPNVSRMNTDLDRTLLATAFKMPRPDEQNNHVSVQTVALPSGDYMVLAVTKITPGELYKADKPTQEAYQKGFSESYSQLEYMLYINDLFSGLKIEFSK